LEKEVLGRSAPIGPCFPHSAHPSIASNESHSLAFPLPSQASAPTTPTPICPHQIITGLLSPFSPAFHPPPAPPFNWRPFCQIPDTPLISLESLQWVQNLQQYLPPPHSLDEGYLEPTEASGKPQLPQQRKLVLPLPHPPKKERSQGAIYLGASGGLLPSPSFPPPENPGRLRKERKAELSLQEIKHEMKTSPSDSFSQLPQPPLQAADKGGSHFTAQNRAPCAPGSQRAAWPCTPGAPCGKGPPGGSVQGLRPQA
jgi:hypothetical protein